MTNPQIIINPDDTIETLQDDLLTPEEPIVEQGGSLREMQEALNKSHPFGIKIWKPALYKKRRGIDSTTYSDLHQIPGSVKSTISVGNVLWCLVFGWWISLLYVGISLFILGPIWLFGMAGYRCCTFSEVVTSGRLSKSFKNMSEMNEYIHVLINLAGYILWPFGKFVAKRVVYSAHEESEPLMREFVEEMPGLASPMLGPIRQESNHYIEREVINSPSDEETWSDDFTRKEYTKVSIGFFKTMYRIWKSGISGVLFFFAVAFILGPVHLTTSFLCYFLILPIPVGKLNYYLLRHLLLHPLQLTSHACDYDPTLTRPRSNSPTGNASRERVPQARPKSVFFWRPETTDEEQRDEDSLLPTIMATPSMRPIQTNPSVSLNREYQIILCTYRAMGLEYLKYTVFGVNIIFVNLLSMIALTLFDFYIVGPRNDYTGIASRGIIFLGGILSTVPLAYFIGMAVSSITAHTGSVAIGAVINATFGSIIEIILYAFGLMEGKEELVQGAMIGSLLLGLLALPGASMLSGGLVRSEQRFNAKSATVTSTMLVVSVIGVFTPTIFQNIHGSYHFDCQDCPKTLNPNDMVMTGGKACRSCRIYQPHPTEDPIYQSHTRPLMYICTVVLLLTYAIGLYFTLGSHLHKIYPKKKPSKKKHVERGREEQGTSISEQRLREQTNPLARPLSDPGAVSSALHVPGPSRLRKPLAVSTDRSKVRSVVSVEEESSDDEGSGHDNPGWSIFWSSAVLLGCTILYTLIAEILIDCLDEIIEHFPMSEKTLGLTVFAIVPTVTEFYNAISFAVSGNIVLSLEIGSAYAIQVALVQIPVLVGFSALWTRFGPAVVPKALHVGKQVSNLMQTGTSFLKWSDRIPDVSSATKSEFTLVFPRWEFYTIIFSVFLLTYVYLEGKSNYFKGALLLLSYIILIAAFFFEPLAIY